jgi:hypothetical protein
MLSFSLLRQDILIISFTSPVLLTARRLPLWPRDARSAPFPPTSREEPYHDAGVNLLPGI